MMLPAAKREQGFETGATAEVPLPLGALGMGTATALICASMRSNVTHVHQRNIRRFTANISFRGLFWKKRPLFDKGISSKRLKNRIGRAARPRGYAQS